VGRPQTLISILWLITARLAADADQISWEDSTDLGQDGTVRAQILGGWLGAERRDTGGQLLWRAAICRATPGAPPVIEMIDPMTVEVRSANGEFSVRDNLSARQLTGQRQLGASFGSVAGLTDGGTRIRAATDGSNTISLTQWEQDGCLWVATGAGEEVYHTAIRLACILTVPQITGIAHPTSGGLSLRWDEAEMVDDGATFLARYVSKRVIQQRWRRHALTRDGIPFEIDPAQWINPPGGEDVRLVDLRGKVVILDFWATWCSPCVAGMPHMAKLQREYHDRGLVVLGVHSASSATGVESFVERRGIPMPVMIDTGETFRRYGLGVGGPVPGYVLIGRDGRLAASGLLRQPPSEAEIERLLSIPDGRI